MNKRKVMKEKPYDLVVAQNLPQLKEMVRERLRGRKWKVEGGPVMLTPLFGGRVWFTQAMVLRGEGK